MSDYPWDISNMYEMAIKESMLNVNRKRLKDSEAGETRRGGSKNRGEESASKRSDQREARTLLRLSLLQSLRHHLSQKLAIICKVRKCAKRYDQ